MSSQDYRVSAIVVLCKDCGNDVGLYPGRHKCPPRPAMPAMPSIPSKYQQEPTSFSSSSRSANGTNGRARPPDLNPNSLHASNGGSSRPDPNMYGNPSPSYGSYGNGSSSRTPTSSSFQERMANNSSGGSSYTNGSTSRTPTASSFQERMKERDREKQQREREEREAASKAALGDSPSSSSTTTPAAGSGTTLWNRLLAAKEVINATITGEEKWPESDDSDHEGESHVGRVLREYIDKKEDAELAAKIAELETTPYDGSSSLSKATGANSSGRNQYLRDASRKENTPSIASSTSSNDREDYYGRSLRARGEPSGGGGADPSERSWSPSASSVSTTASNNSYGSSHLNVGSGNAYGNRYRTTSDASRDDALSRLEGKSQGDKLAAQVSHLGSTSPRARANSPNMGYRSRDQQPPPQQQHHQNQNYNNSSSNSSHNQYQQSYNNQLSPSSTSSHSQRSVSPNANRRYDSPSPANGPSPSRYGGQPQQPISPSYPNNNYRQPQPGPPPSQGYGRQEYERRPTYPSSNGGVPPNGNNSGAYGQRQQQQQQHYQQYQQQQSAYGASRGNYF